MSEFTWDWNEPRQAIDPATFAKYQPTPETPLQQAIRYYQEADLKAQEVREAEEEAFLCSQTWVKNSWSPSMRTNGARR